ncbi:hypothetical protein INT45_013706, partial [Circinella minor]
MKTIRLGLIGRRFDDQYTFDLQGYLSIHDFNSAMELFCEAVRQDPPPGHKGIWIATLLTLWVIVAGTVYILWNFLLLKENSYILLILPGIMLLSSMLWIWRYRHLNNIFQRRIVELCSRINASENIRGVNYRLTKYGSDVQRPYDCEDSIFGISGDGRGSSRRNITTLFGRKTRYVLVIEFDDRYRALQMQQPAVQPPEFVFYPHYRSGSQETYLHPPYSSYPPPPTTFKFNTMTTSTGTAGGSTAVNATYSPLPDEKIQSPHSPPSWTAGTLYNHSHNSN